MQIATDGIVIRETKTGESDRILTVLTRSEGLISASAKHSLRLKNKLASATGLLVHSDFVLFKGKTMYVIDEAESKQMFFELRDGIDTLSLGLYMAELTGAIAQEGAQAGEYLDFLCEGLQLLCTRTLPAKQIKAVYELRLMSMAGYMPDFVACAHCGRYEGGAFYFDLQEGNILCADCALKQEVEPNMLPAALSAIRFILFSPADKIYKFSLGKQSLDHLSALCGLFTQYHLDKPLKSYDFLMKALEE